MRKFTVTFLFFVLSEYTAYSQISSGTSIVFNFTKDKFVVAADSLAGNNDTGMPDYSYCKIAAFGHKFVFVSVGNIGWSDKQGNVPVWNNTDLAGRAFRSVNGSGDRTNLSAIAVRWASDVKSHWDWIDQRDRQLIKNIAASSGGQLTGGVFIGGAFNLKVEKIAYDFNKVIDPVEIEEDVSFGRQANGTTCWDCGQLNGSEICAAGDHLDVATAFCSQRKHGDKIDVRTRLKGASESARLAVKIVEMTIDAYEKTAKDVGGKVDTVTINKNGSITWNSRKPNCPENQD